MVSCETRSIDSQRVWLSFGDTPYFPVIDHSLRFQ